MFELFCFQKSNCQYINISDSYLRYDNHDMLLLFNDSFNMLQTTSSIMGMKNYGNFWNETKVDITTCKSRVRGDETSASSHEFN